MRRNKGRVTSDVLSIRYWVGISDGDYIVISMGSHLVRRVIYFSARKPKITVFFLQLRIVRATIFTQRRLFFYVLVR
jgi:hypothetical protein